MLSTPDFSFSNAPPPTEPYTLSLHDALPISTEEPSIIPLRFMTVFMLSSSVKLFSPPRPLAQASSDCTAVCSADRKSTRLNSSHVAISYAVFCLKKKKKQNLEWTQQQLTRSS